MSKGSVARREGKEIMSDKPTCEVCEEHDAIDACEECGVAFCGNCGYAHVCDDCAAESVDSYNKEPESNTERE